MRVALWVSLSLLASGCYCSHRVDRFEYEDDSGVDSGRTMSDGGQDSGDTGAGADADIANLPDLAITIQRSEVAAGGRTRISFTVHNLGLAGSGPFRVDLWRSHGSDFEDPPLLGSIGESFDYPSLGPRSTRELVEEVGFGDGVGIPVAWAIVDTIDAVRELDEANNVSLGSAWGSGELFAETIVDPVFLTIPDNDMIECHRSSISTPYALFFSFSISHPRASDLFIEVTAPSGEVRRLFLNHGVDGANLIGTTFSDEASIDIISASAPFSGEFLPAAPWSATPMNPNGMWRVRVCDTVPGVTGIFNQWAISRYGI